MERINFVRKSKDDWLVMGLAILGREGIGGLTIERMAAALELTKGSFYHHFKNMEDFEGQLIAYWAEPYLSTAGELPGDPAGRLALLDRIMEETFAVITEPEVAVRIWAHQDKRAQRYVEQVDAARYGFVLNVFRPLAASEEEAAMMADMLFTMTIGSITTLPRIPAGRVLEMYRAFKSLYRLGN